MRLAAGVAADLRGPGGAGPAIIGLAGALCHRLHGTAEVAERRRYFAWDDPDLVRRALSDLRQHLQVLVGEQLGVRATLVNRAEDRLDRLRLPLGVQPLRLALALRPQDRALLLALGGEDLRLLDALGLEDRRAPVALRAHLLLHRLLDGGRRVDRFELDAVHADAPFAGRLVEDHAQIGVDRVARGERLLEGHPAGDVAQ